MCPASLAQHAKAAHRLAAAQNACQRTDFSCSGAFAFTKPVFNVQTANFDDSKPVPTKTFASREHWKGNLVFSCQLLRQVPKTLPGLFEQNLPRFWQKHRPTHFKKLPGWQARPNATVRCAGAVVQSLNRSQDASPPRTRASVTCTDC